MAMHILSMDYRMAGVVFIEGATLPCLAVHAGEWSALPCGSAAPRGTGLPPCKGK
jgi:hypothetical protein